MKLKLPHKEIKLDQNSTYEEKMKFINSLLDERVVFQNERMTIEEYFRKTFNIKSTIVCLDIIGYYLSKEYKVVERDILSRKKYKQMTRGNDLYANFSNLNLKDQLNLGILDFEESND